MAPSFKRGCANHILLPRAPQRICSQACNAELLVNFPDMRVQVRTCLCGWSFQRKSPPARHCTSEIDPKAPYYVIATPQLAPLKLSTRLLQGKLSTYRRWLHRWPRYLASPCQIMPFAGDASAAVGPTWNRMKVYSPTLNWAGVDAPALMLVWSLKIRLPNRQYARRSVDVVILESNRFDASIFGKKPTLQGSYAKLENSAPARIWRWKLKAVVTTKAYESDHWMTRMTSGYKKNTPFSTPTQETGIEKVPEHFKTLMSIAPSDHYYIAGWWPHNDVLANKVMAISENWWDNHSCLCRKFNQPSTILSTSSVG